MSLLRTARVTLLLIPTLLMSGCRNIINNPAIATVTPPSSVTGNWLIYYNFPSGPDFINITSIGGPLTLTSSQDSNTLTGTFHIVTPCFSNGQTNIPLTGSVTSNNQFTLTSPPVNGETFLLRGTFSTSGNTFNQGYIEINGSCTGDLISLTGDDKGVILNPIGTKIPSLTGSWTFAPNFSSSPVVNEQLVQAATPDANGNFALTGTATISGSPCFTSGTLQPGSYVSAAGGQQIIRMNDGSNFTSPLILDLQTYPNRPTLQLYPGYITGGQCNGSENIDLR